MDFVKTIVSIFVFISVLGGWFIYSEIYSAQAQYEQAVTFEIQEDESIKEISKKLEKKGVIRSRWLFEKYLTFRGLDTKVRPGNFKVQPPITLARVAEALKRPENNQMKITIIPGWDLHKLADYFESKNIIRSQDQLYKITGKPAQKTDNTYVDIFDKPPTLLKSKPRGVNLEGYLRPDTYKIYKDSSIEEIIKKLIRARSEQFTDDMYSQVKQKGRTIHEVLTVASMLEREVQTKTDKKKVADILWRRLEAGWQLQMDSTVHYIHGEADTKFTTDKQRSSSNPYNTYEYTGLPPGPISIPSLESIQAAIEPTENDYWYFLTDSENRVHYAKNLRQHNINVERYIK
ncbi:MAG: endolytic transglycosylase MltG [Candidatus Paceibacteria bacterium]